MILSIIIIFGIVYLTFQEPRQTRFLSKETHKMIIWFGISVTEKQLRHYIHYFMYFLVGGILWLWVKRWQTVIIGCGFGLLDEVLKIWLPTREFDYGDFIRDCVGVVVGACVVWLLYIKNLRSIYDIEFLNQDKYGR